MTSELNETLPRPPFADDDGAPDPAVSAALAAYERGDGGPADVLGALAGRRVLVPVVALPAQSTDEAEVVDDQYAGHEVTVASDGSRHPDPEAVEKTEWRTTTNMAAASIIGRDGRRGLLAFTCLDSMRRWDTRARPMPVSTRTAAEAALADGADALVVDLAGPVLFSVDAGELRALASGYRPVAAWSGA